MAFDRVKVLVLLLCATVMVGVSAYAESFGDRASSLRIGMFNSQKKAQVFFESIPINLKQHINRNQLWVNTYQTSSGLVEHHLEISELTNEKSQALCAYVKQQEMQCVISSKSLLPKSSFVPEKVETIEQRIGMSSMLDLPLLLRPLGVRLGGGFDEVGGFDMVLRDRGVGGSFVRDESISSYGAGFELGVQDFDSAGLLAAKAAYDVARGEFLGSLRSFGEGVNAGAGAEAARENLVELGRAAFEAAGSAYLSGFLAGNTNSAAILSGDTNAGSGFIAHVKNNLSSSAKASVDALISDFMDGVITEDDSRVGVLSSRIDEFMLSGARGLIDAGLSSARRSDLYVLRNIELEYNLNNFEDSYLSVLATQPIYQTANLRHSVFLQGGGIVNEQSVDIDDDLSRHTVNVGAAYRYLSPDEKYLLGGNIFYDHQFPYNHGRMSLGIDAQAQDLSMAANYYIPLTDYRDSRTDENGLKYEERALRGYDVELGYTPPFLSDLSVFGKGYQYFRNTDDDIRGLELSAEYNIRDNFTLKGAVVEENGERDGVELALQYRMPLYDADAPNLVLSDLEPSAGSSKSQRSKIFDKVRRENTIRVEERLKATLANAVILTAQFNALSIGLPFDVGGNPTGAAVDLPFDTAITVPNGDFGIITFSNGAIANVSASGAGDVILEFNANILTVTATNGGFVQFISGSGGGITTINVPGGTVNLLGTDVDITDDGVTTTIQVRAGQIGVVPTVGVDLETGNQGDIVSLTIATGVTNLLAGMPLIARQIAAFTGLDDPNPDPPATTSSAPFLTKAPELITGPQFAGNNADIRLTFSQPVTFAGAPFLNGLVGINARVFAYNAGASTPSQPVFRYVFVGGDAMANTITLQDLDLNGGTIIGTANALNAITAFFNPTNLAITDQTAPSLTGSTPVDNEPLFSAGANIVLNFDENVQANIGNITITDTTDGSSTQLIPIGDAQVSIVGSVVTINPTNPLDLSTDYDLTIPSGVIQDTTSNPFAGITSGNLNFTTSNDITPPTLMSSVPADNATQLARNSTITLTFDEDVALTGTINLVDTDNGSGTIAYTSASPEVNVTNNVITITPASNLEYAENYEVTWALGAIQDLVTNNAVASNAGDLNFKTVDLEAALALTGTAVGPDGSIDETNVQGLGFAYDTFGDAIFAAEITIPAAPNGVIFEGGATGFGAWVGFNTGLGIFRARAGDGVALPDNDAPSAEVAIASFTPGNYTLTWELDVALGRIRVWLDENLIASDTAVANMFEGNRWAGTDDFGYGATTSSVTTGDITTSFASSGGVLLSGLRYYDGQTLP